MVFEWLVNFPTKTNKSFLRIRNKYQLNLNRFSKHPTQTAYTSVLEWKPHTYTIALSDAFSLSLAFVLSFGFIIIITLHACWFTQQNDYLTIDFCVLLYAGYTILSIVLLAIAIAIEAPRIIQF